MLAGSAEIVGRQPLARLLGVDVDARAGCRALPRTRARAIRRIERTVEMRMLHDEPGAEPVLQDAQTVALAGADCQAKLQWGVCVMEVIAANPSCSVVIIRIGFSGNPGSFGTVFSADSGVLICYQRGQWTGYLHEAADRIRREFGSQLEAAQFGENHDPNFGYYGGGAFQGWKPGRPVDDSAQEVLR